MFTLAQNFSRFYTEHHIMSETDATLRAARLGLCTLTLASLKRMLDRPRHRRAGADVDAAARSDGRRRAQHLLDVLLADHAERLPRVPHQAMERRPEQVSAIARPLERAHRIVGRAVLSEQRKARFPVVGLIGLAAPRRSRRPSLLRNIGLQFFGTFVLAHLVEVLVGQAEPVADFMQTNGFPAFVLSPA